MLSKQVTIKSSLGFLFLAVDGIGMKQITPMILVGQFLMYSIVVHPYCEKHVCLVVPLEIRLPVECLLAKFLSHSDWMGCGSQIHEL